MRNRICRITFALLVAAAVAFGGARPALAQSTLPVDFSAMLPQPADAPDDQAPVSSFTQTTPDVALPATTFIKPSFRGLNFADQQTPIAPGTQANIRQGFGVFFLIGPMFDQFSSDDSDISFDNQTGLQLTLGLGGNFSGFFGVGTELTLLRRTFEEDVTANTFQIPLLFYLNGGCHRINCFNFHVIFGPAFDFVMSTDGISIDEIERYQIDIIVGGMVEISRFMFQARYVQGIRAVNKEFDEFGKIKTRTFVLLFGIRLN
jgi:hypothetical protein